MTITSISALRRTVMRATRAAAGGYREFSGLAAATAAAARPLEHHVFKHPGIKEICQPPAAARQHAHINSTEQYFRMHRASLEHPDAFWGSIAEGFNWHRKWDRVMNAEFDTPSIKWFEGGKLNITENALDRHIAAGFGDAPAVTWESDDGQSLTFTFSQVLQEVNAVASVLAAQGVRKGDRVSLYLPMVPQLLFLLLACARIGAVHSTIFAGFSAEAVAERLVNCRSDVVVTADAGLRGGKVVPLKPVVDEAVQRAAARGNVVRHVLVTHRAGAGADERAPGWVLGRDLPLDRLVEEVKRAAGGGPVVVPPAIMDAEDPLFILYTSGSTGAPKGVLHSTAGYMVYAATTFRAIFDARPSAARYPPGSHVKPDLHFCTADLGWVTGHTYATYGPLLTGTHTLLFEGTPAHPGPDRLWQVVAKHQATTLYTAPTALRALMVHGDEPVKKHDLSSLRLLGSVGEPINEEAWRWFHKTVGGGRCPIVDTYWQTETGGVIVTSLPGATHMKPGAATKPFFGIDARVVREDGTECGDDEPGLLVVDKPWPGMLRTVYGDHARFRKAYLHTPGLPGRYFTGDGAVRDKDGDIRILGRTDDVLNTSGHRLSTAEVESALGLHPAVAEAAVVGYPHAIKGEGIYAFCILKAGGAPVTPELRKELAATVRKAIGPIATPDVIHVTPELPKTRSGKIMRRILRKVAAGEQDAGKMGDVTTLADPSIVARLIADRPSFLPA